nr:ubiquitin fusion degradation protein 1 homolog isoform X2 [Quercus suber]
MAYENRHFSTFEHSYRCYPVSFIDKPHLEKGDKIIMPPSALDRLASLQIEYPMLFELNNPAAGRVTHCGVLEFIADEGLIYLPYWMMENMLLQEGDVVQLKNASLAKGTYVKLQPHTKDFLDVSNPKAILETSLRSYSCLTTVSIIETDCEVDFAPPLDYKEPEKPAKSALLNRKRSEDEDEPAKKMAKFSPFTGFGRRLDGRPSTESVAPDSSPILKQHQSETQNGTKDSKSSNPASRQPSGKLVFGSNVNQPKNEKSKVAPKNSNQEPPQKEEEPKFQAFTGKKYSLKG